MTCADDGVEIPPESTETVFAGMREQRAVGVEGPVSDCPSPVAS
jgi:hypothetical protein